MKLNQKINDVTEYDESRGHLTNQSASRILYAIADQWAGNQGHITPLAYHHLLSIAALLDPTEAENQAIPALKELSS